MTPQKNTARRDVATAAWNAPLTPEGRPLARNLRRAVCGIRRPLRAGEVAAVGALVRRDGR